MAREVRIERRGAPGLDAAEKLFVTRDADGERLIPAPTGEALFETLTAPLTAAATSVQQIGEQVEARADEALATIPPAVASANTAAAAANTAAGEVEGRLNDVDERYLDLVAAADAANPDAITAIYVPANLLSPIAPAGVTPPNGVPIKREGQGNTRLPSWNFPDALVTYLAMEYRFPAGWNQIFVDFHLINPVANAGNLSIAAGTLNYADGESVNVTPASSSATVAANSSPNIAFTVTHTNPLTVDPTKRTIIRINRNGNSAADTLPSDIYLTGLTFRRVG